MHSLRAGRGINNLHRLQRFYSRRSNHLPRLWGDGQATSPATLPIGTQLAGGRYIIDKVLGQGGFDIIYKGTDTRLQRPVAITEFFPEEGSSRSGTSVQLTSLSFSDFADMRRRLLEQAREQVRILAQFDHPGIEQVLDVFEENNTVYIVRKYLRGKLLRAILEERGVG